MEEEHKHTVTTASEFETKLVLHSFTRNLGLSYLETIISTIPNRTGVKGTGLISAKVAG